MSTKHVRTTGDLMRFKAALKVTCRDCGAAATFSCTDAVMAFGNVPLWHTEERLKCSRCGKRHAKVEFSLRFRFGSGSATRKRGAARIALAFGRRRAVKSP